MNARLTPHFVRRIDGVNLLWFKQSNNYIIFDDDNLAFFNCFLNSKNYSSFNELVHQNYPLSNTVTTKLYSEFTQLTESCHKAINTEQSSSIHFSDKKWLLVFYDFGNTIIKIHYSSENEKALIHPQFAHLECQQTKESTIAFYIDKDNNLLNLFINKNHLGSYKDVEYHLLQGKFSMELLCVLTKTKENDWLGTFHASTVANNHEAIMIVGESGKGKSSLTALLMANGYFLMADDFTPILAKSQEIYSYPVAISLKEGSYGLVESLFKKTDYSTSASLNTKKGMIRYIMPKDKPANSLPCSKIVLVNYQSDANTEFRKILSQEVLPILIPDSWLSTCPENANYFLNWLERLQFFELTYSNNHEAVSKFHDLFND